MISQPCPNDFAGAEVTGLIFITDSTHHLTLHPPQYCYGGRAVLSPDFVGGEGKAFAVFPKNLGLDWLCRHPQNKKFTVACPLLGERKQVRASVSTNFVVH